MFGKVKKWLGIEGVKLELDLPEEIRSTDNVIYGKAVLYSLHAQVVSSIKIVLIERYSRGRKEERKIDEYQLGETVLTDRIYVPAEEPVQIDFSLPFTIVRSDMDKWQRKNFLFKALVKTAKRLDQVSSEYRIEAEAKVEGTALNPFDKQPVNIK